MSLRSDVVISFEELRAVSHMVTIATSSIESDDDSSFVQRYHSDVAKQVVAGIQSKMLTQLRSMPAGDHLRDLYWGDVEELGQDPDPGLSEQEIIEFEALRALGPPPRRPR